MSQPSPASLAQDQQQLLRVLLGDRDTAGLMPRLRARNAAGLALAERGLLAYQSHGLALAGRVLAEAYPIILQLVGNDNFAPMARQFWHQHPPVQGDMACWGGELAAFIEAAPQLASEPFLGDVARVEWSLHQAATAEEARPDLPSIALLTSHAPDTVTLRLSPGAAVLASVFPVVSIVRAHLGGKPDLTRAGELLKSGVGEHALVWRHGFQPKVTAISKAEFSLIRALLGGQPLAQAVDTANENASGPFDFNGWLLQAAQMSLVTGAQVLSLATTRSSIS